MTNGRFRTQRDIERVLAGVPLNTPEDESHASDMLQIFITLRNSAFSGAGVSVPGLGIPFSIPALIDQLKEGNYPNVAITLMSIGGDAAGAFSFLVTAGTQAGAITGTSALASAGVVAGMVAEAAGPAAIAAAVLVATFRIPGDVSANNSKLFFIADTSGILTSWMFNMPEISPHTRLMRQARHGGYFRTDISEQCRLAHRRVEVLWRRNYQGNTAARRAAKQSANNSWERYWLQIGRALEARLSPFPTGIGASMVRREINESRRLVRRSAQATRRRQLQQQRRRAAGGYWFRTSDGHELFMPDTD